jgi:outer membrane protein assembly factor BamB
MIEKLTGTEKDARLFELARDLANQPIEDDAAAPVVPAFQPLVVGNLVITRTLADLRAFDLATGQFAWASGEKDQPLLNALRSTAGPQANAARGLPRELLLVLQRLWQDLSYGTLSSDGQRVFAVEDLDLLAVVFSQRGEMAGLRGHNRLAAYDAKSGKAAWEVGGPHTGNGDPLAGLFFLGPPLVFEHRLFCLAEMGSEPVLVVLDPRDGALELLQPLGDDDPVARAYDVSRRMAGLTPSCEDGILVCPLGADRVTAYDVARRRLLWSYRFRPRIETTDPRRQHFQMLERQIARSASGRAEQAGWLDAGAVISGTRVWLTPTESNDLVCLNLHDGTLAWKKPRGEALYLAGVRDDKVILVGRSFVHALRAHDGEAAWPQPVALTTIGGRGYFSESFFVQPLARGEVASIDTRDGRLVARTRSLGPTVIGNMLAVNGSVVSQSADSLGVFRQFETLEAEVVRALAANPRDSRALALRGEMRLQRGAFSEAIDDLEQAVALDPAFAEARELLFTSLIEGLRVDFARNRHYRGRLEELLATPEQRSTYLWLVANGLTRAAEKPAAFEALLGFADPGVSDQECERVENGLLVRRDRLVRARALELLSQASADELASMRESLLRYALAASADSDGRHLRRFLHYFGSVLNDASLAENTLRQPWDPRAPLSEEFRLMRMAGAGPRPLAARATAQLAEALLEAGLAQDVLPLAARLESEFADLPCLEGATGRDLVALWRERRDLDRAQPAEIDWPTGRIEVSRQAGVGNSGGAKPSIVPLDGAAGPFFERSILELGVGGQYLQVRDALGRIQWKLPLESPVWPGQVQLNRVWTRDHLLLALIGNELLAIDRLGTSEKPGPRLLWQLGLVEGSMPGSVQRGVVDLRRRRGAGPVVPEQIGVVGPLSYDHVSYLRGRKLTVAEPLTGKPLWVRDGLVPGSGLFGDDELLFVSPPGVQEALVFRTLDGSFEGTRRLPPAAMWLETVGRRIPLWGKPLDRQILALRDAWTGQDAWSRDFSPGSAVSLVELDEALVLEPSGMLSIVRMSDGQTVHQAQLEATANLRELVALRSREQYILIANEPLPNAPAVPRPVSQQNIPVHGMVHALDRATGRRLWSTRVERQSLDPSQPLEWPILTFASHLFEPRRAGNGVDHRFFMLCLDKRTGRIIHEDSRTDEPLHFIEYLADFEARQLELRFFQSSVLLQFTDKPPSERSKDAPESAQ